MVDASEPDAGSTSTPPIAFDRTLVPLATFIVVTTVATPLLFTLGDRFLPETLAANLLFTATSVTFIALVAWATLRWEGLTPTDVGLTWQSVVPGVLTVLFIWLAVNVLGYGFLTLQGEVPALGIPANTTLTGWLANALVLWVFVGIGEEFAFRGYLQNKVIAHVGLESTRMRKAAGIAIASVLFSLWHVPQLGFVQGLAPVEMLPVLVVWATYGIVLGTVYELTRNVVLVGLFHGTFDLNPIFVLGANGAPVVDLTILVLPVAAVAVWGYRRWASSARPEDFRPQSTAASA